MCFRLVPNSVTLNDLERRNGVILRYFSEFGQLPGALRKSSRSLSHLLISSCYSNVALRMRDVTRSVRYNSFFIARQHSTAMQSAMLTQHFCPQAQAYICVCPSHAGIVCKRLNPIIMQTRLYDSLGTAVQYASTHVYHSQCNFCGLSMEVNSSLQTNRRY